MNPPTDPLMAELTRTLDNLTNILRELYLVTNEMEAHGRLGSAARIPDEIARACACVRSSRDAAAYEAGEAA